MNTLLFTEIVSLAKNYAVFLEWLGPYGFFSAFATLVAQATVTMGLYQSVYANRDILDPSKSQGENFRKYVVDDFRFIGEKIGAIEENLKHSKRSEHLQTVARAIEQLRTGVMRRAFIDKIRESNASTQFLEFVIGYSTIGLAKKQVAFQSQMPYITKMLEGIGELDILFTSARLLKEEPHIYSLPKLLDSKQPKLKIIDGHFPFLLRKESITSIANDAFLSAPPYPEELPILNKKRRDERLNWTQVMVLTGRNGRGKSTYSRMVGANVRLATLGMPVAARSMEVTPMRVVARMDTKDSVLDDTSKFQAQLKGIQEIEEDLLADNPKKLVILDELFNGTNPTSQAVATLAMLANWVSSCNLFIISSHNFRLAQTLEGTGFSANFSIGANERPFKVEKGIDTRTNLIEQLEKYGFDETSISNARSLLNDNPIHAPRPLEVNIDIKGCTSFLP